MRSSPVLNFLNDQILNNHFIHSTIKKLRPLPKSILETIKGIPQQAGDAYAFVKDQAPFLRGSILFDFGLCPWLPMGVDTSTVDADDHSSSLFKDVFLEAVFDGRPALPKTCPLLPFGIDPDLLGSSDDYDMGVFTYTEAVFRRCYHVAGGFDEAAARAVRDATTAVAFGFSNKTAAVLIVENMTAACTDDHLAIQIPDKCFNMGLADFVAMDALFMNMNSSWCASVGEQERTNISMNFKEDDCESSTLDSEYIETAGRDNMGTNVDPGDDAASFGVEQNNDGIGTSDPNDEPEPDIDTAIMIDTQNGKQPSSGNEGENSDVGGLRLAAILAMRPHEVSVTFVSQTAPNHGEDTQEGGLDAPSKSVAFKFLLCAVLLILIVCGGYHQFGLARVRRCLQPKCHAVWTQPCPAATVRHPLINVDLRRAPQDPPQSAKTVEIQIPNKEAAYVYESSSQGHPLIETRVARQQPAAASPAPTSPAVVSLVQAPRSVPPSRPCQHSVEGPQEIPAQIPNSGVTCFLASIYQCLLAQPVIKTFLLSLSPQHAKTDVIAQLAIAARVGRCRGRIEIHEFDNFFNAFLSSFRNNQAQVQGRAHQQDNGEACRHLIAKATDEEPAIDDLFGWTGESERCCFECGCSSEPVITRDKTLLLPVRPHVKAASLQSLVDDVFSLSDVEACCPGCGHAGPLRSRQRVCSASSILPIEVIQHFNREQRKPWVPLTVPLRMTLPVNDFYDSVSDAIEYELTALTVHVSSRTTSGHFIAYVRRPTPTGDWAWFCCDDAAITRLTHEQMSAVLSRPERDRSPNLVFYERIDK